jgi:hypothetical protein
MKDTPFDRQLFVTMTPQEQLAWLNQLRERRLATVRMYQQKMAQIAADKRAKLTAKLERAFVAMEKAYAKFEEASTKLDVRITTMHALLAMTEDADEEQRDTGTAEGEDYS